LDQILDSGILPVGTTGDYEPFSYRAFSEAEFQGIDIALARDLAKTSDVEIRFIQTTWPSPLENLEQGHFDIAMSGISRHPARRKVGFFSDTYHTGGKTPISWCENKEKFDTLEKINSSTTRIIVNPGGTNEQLVDPRVNQAKKIYTPTIAAFSRRSSTTVPTL
jgi:cyclohexadienyl dehydratase